LYRFSLYNRMFVAIVLLAQLELLHAGFSHTKRPMILVSIDLSGRIESSTLWKLMRKGWTRSSTESCSLGMNDHDGVPVGLFVLLATLEAVAGTDC
jgi:hypothetical protein